MGQDQSNFVDVETPTRTRQKAKIDDIVVVSKVNSKEDKQEDEDIQRLKSIRLSKPIFSNSIGELEYISIPRVNAGPLSEMILRYQFHMTECAEAVSFDQNALSKRIKEVDTLALNTKRNISERNKLADNIINQIKKATEVRYLMERIEANLQSTKLQFQQLNVMLPEDEQIKDDEFFNCN